MTNNEAIRLYQLLWQVRGETSQYVVSADVELLRKLSRRLQTIAVNECNRGLTEREQHTRDNIRLALTKVRERYQRINMGIGGDPRGYALVIHFPRDMNAYNTMGGLEGGYGVAA